MKENEEYTDIPGTETHFVAMTTGAAWDGMFWIAGRCFQIQDPQGLEEWFRGLPENCKLLVEIYAIYSHET